MTKLTYTSFLMGGLGNQMFQIANCLSQSWDNDAEPKFNRSSWIPMQGNDTSTYINGIFKNIPFHDNINIDVRINEGSYCHSIISSPKDKNVEFYGYFQSRKYFDRYQNKIKELFQPEDAFLNEISKKYPEILMDNTLSLHIRRGDYTSNPDIHPSIDISYINEALKIIGNYSYVFIFSDDIEWVENNLSLENTIIVKGNKDFEDLWLMSLCKNNIICNSSFSWWGSFLNQNPNKIIVSPSIWFGPRGPQDYHDIFEENWIKINTKYKNGKLCY